MEKNFLPFKISPRDPFDEPTLGFRKVLAYDKRQGLVVVTNSDVRQFPGNFRWWAEMDAKDIEQPTGAEPLEVTNAGDIMLNLRFSLRQVLECVLVIGAMKVIRKDLRDREVSAIDILLRAGKEAMDSVKEQLEEHEKRLRPEGQEAG